VSPSARQWLLNLIFWLAIILIILIFPRAASSTCGKNVKQAQETEQKIRKKRLDPKDDPDQIGKRDVGRGINLYSLEKEIALGKQLAQEVEKAARIADDPVISEYVNRLGQNLVRNSDAKIPFTIKVIDGEEINAFALPGGYFFIYAGLIRIAESEAELASAMAHEIAHVTARHGTRQASRGQIANLATIPLIFIGGWPGYGVQQATGILVPVAFLKFSRAFEEEADRLGLQYLYKSGYDPTAAIDFFERIESLEKKKPGTLSKVFSSHPMTKDRIKKAQKHIREVLKERPDYIVTTAEFTGIKEELEKQFARRKPTERPGAPTLRKKPSGKIEPGEEGKEKKEEEEKPTLKRRN
jgi:predicted Zn-dependent protease